MKKTWLILGGIGLLCLLLFVRSFYRQHNRQINERKWFVKQLKYEFSAQIDSVKMLNENTGKLWCTVTEGNPESSREDSLKQSFESHDMLYLIFHQAGDSIVFLVHDAKQISKGDSVRVSSGQDKIQIFSARTLVFKEALSNTLTGFGRPFFLNRKKK